MGFFSLDGPLMRFLNLTANLFILHVLWLIYSIPLITVGASTTALCYSCMKLIRKQEGYLWKTFHKAFLENLKQSTIIWLIIAAFAAVFITDIRYAFYLNNRTGNLMLAGCILVLIPFLFTVLYIFPVQAKFENKITDNLKNALLMSIRHLPFTLILIFILGSLIFLGVFFRPFTGLMLCIGAGLSGYLTSSIFVMIFRKYLPDELENDLEFSGERFEP